MSSVTLASESYPKLTVPQLRAICKEKKIVGYSKIGKAALLEKLQAFGLFDNVPPPTSTLDINQASLVHPVNESSTEPDLRPTRAREDVLLCETRATLRTPSSVPSLEITTVTQISANAEEIPTSGPAAPASKTINTHVNTPTNDVKARVSSGVVAIPKRAGEGRSDSKLVRVNKKQRTGLSTNKENCTQIDNKTGDKSRLLGKSISVSTKKIDIEQKAIVPTEPRAQAPLESSVLANTLQTKSAARFKPLSIKMKDKYEQQAKNNPLQTSSHCQEKPTGRSVYFSLNYLEFGSTPLISLEPISLPPSLSQRKRVQAMSIIMSGLDPPERRQCLKVSRMFRYAGCSS